MHWCSELKRPVANVNELVVVRRDDDKHSAKKKIKDTFSMAHGMLSVEVPIMVLQMENLKEK